MNILSSPVVAMAGISLYVGLYHLLIFIRRPQNRADFTFALLCFSIVGYDAFCVGLYNASTVIEGAQWQRAQLISMAFFVPAFLWFVSDYTRQKPGVLVYVFWIYYLLAVIVQLIDRSSLTWLVDQPSIKHTLLPFGLSVTYYEVTFGPFTTVQSFMGLFISAYLMVMAVRHFKVGNQKQAKPLILGLVLMYAAAFNDTLVANGLYHFVYLMEYAFLGIVVVMAFSLSTTVVDAAIAKDALKKSEERFRSLVETTSDWVWEINADGVYTYASPKIRDLLGYEPEEVVGKTPFDLMPVEESKRVSALFQGSVRSQRPIERVENVCQSKDDHPVVLETSGVPFFDESGKLSGYRGIDRDITERKRVEEVLQESRNLLQTVLDTIPARIFWKDHNLRYLGCNRPFALDAGAHSPKEVIGKDDYQMGWREEADLYRNDDRQVLEAGIPKLNYEEPQTTPDGRHIWLRTNKVPLQKADGAIWGVLGTYEDITERRQAEEALRQATLVVENSPVILFRWRAAAGWPVVMVSQNVVQFGYTPEELLNGSVMFSSIVYPDDLERVSHEVLTYSTSGVDRFKQEYRIVTKDGHVRWIEDRTTVERNDAGHVTHYQGIVVDVTERKYAESALRENEVRYRALVESQIDLVSRYLPDTNLTYVNDAYCKFFGKTRQELIGQSYMFMIAPEFRDMVASETKKLAEENGTTTGEYINYRYDGKACWIQWVVKCITDENNHVIELQAVGRDITPLKEAEEALQESEERYRRLVEVSPIPMWINKDGLITYMNPVALRTIGATHLEQVVGRPALDFVHPDYHEMVKERISQMVAEEKIVPLLEEKYVRLDGEIIDVEVIATPFTTPGGRAMQVLFQDITKRKLNEAEREALISDLEARNVELERFTYTISHDLKSPLVTINGFLGYLEKDARTGNMERLRSDIRRIQEAVNKMRRLLNELLELSRIGRLVNPPEMIPFADLVQDALDVVHGQLEEGGIAVMVQPDLPAVFGDRQRLKEVLQNLIDNAAKFMGAQRNPQIEIGQLEEAEQGKPVFFVKDNGMGIATKYHEQVFGLFNKLNPDIEGTGIGLALVKRIIEVHGGKIWIESEAGKGTTFYFTLSEPSRSKPAGV